ncbi:MAG: response regulator [Spirochaetales bacterium]|jgi:two-component system response regulator YesN
MRRILIVDDEQPVASGIAHIVRRDFSSDYEIAGLAGSGREAIEKVGQLNPDIILMDVRMPGFSGLDAIRELRKRGTTSAFIMITAYERFEIAREAIELGVVDYLLKPVSTQALATSLSMAVSYLDRNDELERNKLELNECFERVKLFAEKAFLYGIMQGENLGFETQVCRNILGLQGESALIAALGCPGTAIAGSHQAGVAGLYASMAKAIKYKTDFLLSPLVSGLCMVFLPLRGPASAAEAASAAASLEKLLSQLQESGGASHLIAGYGSPRPYGEASQSWNEAVTDLYSRASAGAQRIPSAGAQRIPSASGLPLPRTQASPTPAGIDELQNALLEGSEFDARLIVDTYIASHKPDELPDPAEVCSFISLIGGALRTLRRDGQIDAREEADMMAMDDLYAAPDFGAFANAARARILRLSGMLREAAPRHAPAVSAAMAYVRRNYASPINLDLAAAEIGISPGRLSRLFVEETGKGFSHYLIGFRLEKAKEMLAKPGASIKEVSAACGYPDQNYFARLFKKVTGLTPSSFFPSAPEEHDET